MKKLYMLLPLIVLPLIFIITGFSTGSPGGRTGSVGDNGNNCTACHSGTAQTVSGWITSNIPPTGYLAGETYTITATGTHTGVGKFGFELTAEDAAGQKTGAFIITNAAQTKLVNQNKAVTHTSGGTTPSGNSKSWSMDWTAPAASAGNVTFYAAFNAADGTGGTGGDVIYLSTTTVQPQGSGVAVTFRVDMSEETISPLGVHIAGNFQGWDPGATELTDTGNSIFAITLTFNEGDYLEYKFINGNDWGMEEQVMGPCVVPPDNNRFLNVPGDDIVLEAVCFGSCVICNPGNVEITFQVDLSNETVSPLGVHIAGDFQGWDPAGTPMQHIGNDVYAVTVDLGVGNYHEYKFVNGNAWGMDETVPPECASGWNRFITVPQVPTTLDAVCFGSCSPCGPPPIDIQVTFQVDLSNEIVSPDGVHIAGGFQGWNPGSTMMTDMGDNIYSYTTILPSGTYQEYKFINGTTWDQSENVPPECGVNNNRYLTVPWADTILPAVCYGECQPCGPPPAEVEVSFRVDLANEEISPDGIHLAGSFQGWDPQATPMINSSEDIYEVVITFLSGTYIEYKFINGNTFDGAELVPEECGVDDGYGGFSRYLTVPDENISLEDVCFSSCDTCVTVYVMEKVPYSEASFYPNPAKTTLYFNPQNDKIQVSIFAVDGKMLIEETIFNGQLNISKLTAGLYFIRMENETGTETKKLIIQ
jgi:hypothetical protein